MPFVIIVLALGTFAIGTDGYLVAGLLPNIASDMKVTVGATGQLVTLFAITYAFGSPLLSTLTAEEIMQTALIPMAYTIGTDFHPGRRVPLEKVVHWNRW
jgi:predicted MFS family arabinose efflux permease